MGNRFPRRNQARAMPWHHKTLQSVLTSVLNLFFHAGIGDSHCGHASVHSARFMTEWIGAAQNGSCFRVCDQAASSARVSRKFPSRFWPDQRGRPPHLRSFRDGWRHFRFMLL